jgi:hypothetical protein
MKNYKAIYERAKQLIEEAPEEDHPSGNIWAGRNFSIQAKLIVREFDGDTGPLYTLIGNSKNEAIQALTILVAHLEQFYPDKLD